MSAQEAWRKSVPDLLGEIADVATRVLCEAGGMEADRAQYLGYLIMRGIAETAGGTQVYLPKADSIARCNRDEEIFKRFNGMNQRELAIKYGITEVHVYRIVRRMREANMLRKQRSLDPKNPG